MARQLTEGNMDWELYGPDNTANPEPTQHALEKSEAIMSRYTLGIDPSGYGAGVIIDNFTGRVNGMIEKETAAGLERQAERLLERAREVRAKYDRFGEDDFPDGAVIVFDKTFDNYGGRPIPKSKPYHYAAMKFNGLWNTTGPRSPKGYTWDELIRWMGDGVEEIYYVKEIVRFV